MPVYKKVNKDFFKKWNPGMAYVLGFFAADGYITVNNRGGQFWCIQITDKEVLQKIKEVIHAEHKIGTRTKKRNESTLYRLQIGSIEMCDDLRRLGFYDRKTRNLSLPHVPMKYLSDFVRGYFDGDGNVWVGYVNRKRKKPRYVMQTAFTSCSSEFLSDLHSCLIKFGIQGGCMYRNKLKSYARLSFGTQDSLKLFEIMYNKPHKLFLNRKKLVFRRFIKMRP